ncbi:M48 family metallopeptidase [Thiomicrolovo sp. ZZH C-3]
MVTALMVMISFYFIAKLYISVMQVGFINRAKRMAPVLMGSADYLKAGNYAVAKEKLQMTGMMIEYIMFIVWLDGGIRWLESVMGGMDEPFKSIVMVLAFLLINTLVELPLSLYEKFVLDAKFGFNRTSVGLYVKDTLITLLLVALLGGAVIWGVTAIIASTALWWFWSFLFLFAVVVALNMLFPTLRALFFDKLTPLEDAELAGEIDTLMQKTGFVSSGVFVSDASKRDTRLNAYFGGLGKSKRVVLYDTLLEKLDARELLAVLGHELGHFAHGDLYKNIAVVGGMLFGMLALFGNLPASLFEQLGVGNTPAVTVILFMLFMPLVSFFIMPLMGVISRRNEYEADRSGGELVGKLYLANALRKLVTENRAFPLSHPLYIFFYYTHPPVIERLRALGFEEQGSGKGAMRSHCDADSVERELDDEGARY